MHQTFRQDGQYHRVPNQEQLQKCIDLGVLGRMHLCAGQTEVPVPRHRLGWGQGYPAEIDGGYGQADVSAENYRGEPQRQRAVDREADDGDGHKSLVGHGVDHRADYCRGVEAPGEIAVDKVRYARVEEERYGGERLRGQDEVAHCWSGDEPCEGQDVGERVDVLVQRGKAWEDLCQRCF